MATVPPVGFGYAIPPLGARLEQADNGPHHGGPRADVTASLTAAAALDPLIAALADALETAAVRQNGLAPLFADLEELMVRPNVPPAVRAAAEALLHMRLPENGLTGSTLKQAVSRSGLFLEAMLANGIAPNGDMKSGLQALRASLQKWLGVENAPADLRLAAPPLPPPFRGAPAVAQPPVPASIGDTDLRQAALTVLSHVDDAIARHVMLQIASLPASQQPSHPPDDHTQRFVFDIPIDTRQGTAVVQLQIERDARRTSETQQPAWSVRFAIDIEPIGPVQAHVAVVGARTNVTLVAERPGGADALKQDVTLLKSGLAQAALDPGDIHCHTHAAPTVAAPRGQFLNRAL